MTWRRALRVRQMGLGLGHTSAADHSRDVRNVSGPLGVKLPVTNCRPNLNPWKPAKAIWYRAGRAVVGAKPRTENVMRYDVLAIALPSRKAGLWELKTTHENSQAPPEVVRQCIDTSTDKLISDKAGGSQDACSKPEIRKSGNAIVTESRCKTGAVAMTTRATYDGDFNSAVTGKVSTTQEGGPVRPQLGGSARKAGQPGAGRERPRRRPVGLRADARDADHSPDEPIG